MAVPDSFVITIIRTEEWSSALLSVSVCRPGVGWVRAGHGVGGS